MLKNFDRRKIIFASIALPMSGFCSTIAWAQIVKTIDRRVRSDDHLFGLTFSAEKSSDASPLGHAFILWQAEDDSKQMSTSEAIGFYPAGDADGLKLIFGTAGDLESDVGTPADYKLTVLLNADQYQSALARKTNWEQDGTYDLLWNNCTTHVADIASSIGLTTSSGNWQPPENYLQDLMNNNN
jgi:hypothetical protein